MPLSAKARIEVYVPDLPTESSLNLLDTFESEFTYALGGCTIIRGLDGSYLSRQGTRMRDRVNLVYSDTPFPFDDNVLHAMPTSCDGMHLRHSKKKQSSLL